MNNKVLRDFYKRGLITRAEYIDQTGEDPDPPSDMSKVPPGADSGLVNIAHEEIKKDPEHEARVAALLAGMGGHRQPTPDELARAAQLAHKPLAGEGFKCFTQSTLVTSCPRGDYHQCPAHTRCQYATAEMSRVMGAKLNDRIAEDGTVTVNDMASTMTGRAALSTNNDALTKQALALMRMREGRK